MNPFRSVGARLSVALVVVVAAALAIVYVGLVPALERRLENAKLAQLERSVRVIRSEYSRFDPDFVTTASDTANARVAVYQLLASSPATLQITDYSLAGEPATDLTTDPEHRRRPLVAAHQLVGDGATDAEHPAGHGHGQQHRQPQ